MALDAAEEESIEALKKWWKENGNQLIAIVVVVVVGYGGWTFWSGSQADAAAQASDVYEEILTLALPSSPDEEITDADREQISSLAAELKENSATSIYAHYAALFAAQKAVEVNDLDSAESELQWVVDNQPSGLLSSEDEGLVLTASLRLGRVILAKGDADRALVLVNSVDPKSFEAGFAELRGDIYVALGRLSDAGEAYRAALQAGAASTTLQMKLDNVTG